MGDKIQGYSITLDGSGVKLFCPSAEAAIDSLKETIPLEELALGETITIRSVEVTEQELEQMGEFEGF
jgi:hypothetical protein